jgi:hypothetical protein
MAARAPRQRPTYPHWHISWGVVDKGDLFGDQCHRSARSKVTKRFLVLPCPSARWSLPHRADARANSLVKVIISLHIYHHLLFTRRHQGMPCFIQAAGGFVFLSDRHSP